MAKKQRSKARAKSRNYARRAKSHRSQQRQQPPVSTASAYQPQSAVPLLHDAAEGGKLLTHSAAVGLALTEKAVAAAKSPVLIGAPTKWLDLWGSSVRALQANVAVMSTLSVRFMRSWFQLIQPNPQGG